VDERIFISGQIGLVPSSLSLPSRPSLAFETALSFQHVDRVVSALKNNSGGGWDGHEQGVLYWLANENDVQHVKEASGSYEKDACAAVLFIVVSALPKGALVEKQTVLHTGRCLMPDEDDMVMRSITPIFKRGDRMCLEGSRTHWEISYFNETSSSVALLCFRGEDPKVNSHLKDIPELSSIWRDALSVRLFYRPDRISSSHSTLNNLFDGANKPPVTSIPCYAISTRGINDDWDYAMFIV